MADTGTSSTSTTTSTTEAVKQVMRYEIADYINVNGLSGATEDFQLMGTGFTKMDEDSGTKTDSKTYINEKSASIKVTGYENKFKFESDLITNAKAGAYIYKIGHDKLTGADAQTTYVRVDIYDPVSGKNNEFNARKFKVSVVADSVEGNGGEGVTFSGELDGIGDPIIGTFNTSTGVFTAASAS